MKIDKIVTAYDHNPLYSSFKDLTVEAWKRLGIEVQAEPMTPTRGVASAIMAKITRLLAASSEENTDKFVMIADIDMVPLASPLSAYDGCPDHHLCQFVINHLNKDRHQQVSHLPLSKRRLIKRRLGIIFSLYLDIKYI